MEGAGSEKRGDCVSSQRPRRLLPPVWVQKGFWWCRVGWQLSPDRACLFCLYNVFQTRPLLPVSSSIPGQPTFPASLWPCLLHPCPSTHSPFSPQGDGLEPQTRACHFLHKRPSVASRCTWTKTQAPSAGGSQRAQPNSPSHAPSVPQAPPHWPHLAAPSSLQPPSQPLHGRLLLPGVLLPQATHGDPF